MIARQEEAGVGALLAVAAIAATPLLPDFFSIKLFVAGTGLAVLAWLHRREWVWSRGSWWLPLWLLASLPALVGASNPGRLLEGLLLDFFFVLALWLGSRGRSADTLASWLSGTQLAVFALWCGDGIVFDGPLQFGALSGSSPLGNPDHVAEFSVITLLASAMVLEQTTSRSKKILAVVSILSSVGVLWVSGGVTAWLALAVGGGGWLFRWGRGTGTRTGDGRGRGEGARRGTEERRRGGTQQGTEGRTQQGTEGRTQQGRKQRGRRAVVAGLAILVALVVAGSLLLVPGLRSHVQRRAVLFGISAEVFLEKPLTGWGVGEFPRGFLDVQGEKMREDRALRPFWTNARHPHDAVLFYAAERGLAAGLLASIGLVALLVLAFRCPSLGLGAMVSSLLTVFLGSKAGSTVPFVLLLGALSGAMLGCGSGAGEGENPGDAGFGGRGKPREPKPGDGGRKPGDGESGRGRRGNARTAAFLALCLALVAIPGARLSSDVALVAGAPETSLRFWPWNARAALEEPDGVGNACKSLEHSQAMDPTLYKELAVANCLQRTRQFHAAAKAYLKVLAWKPDFAAGYANLSVLYWETEQPDLACRHGIRALSLRPGDPRIQAIHKRVCPVAIPSTIPSTVP